MTGVLVVGTGAIAEQHIAALRGSDRAELTGLVDTDPARGAAASRANGGVRWSTDLAEALAWPEVDGCVVCTPNGSHAGIARAVATAGKHLLMEKPLATTTADARAVVEAFRTAGRVLAAAHTHRAYDYSRTVKSIVDSGRIGAPRLIRASMLGGWIWGDWSAWAIDPRRSGGHSLHNGVHLLDLVTWWMGARPDSVYARGRKQTAAELGIYDYLEIILRFPGERVAHCEMSRAHRLGGQAHRDVYIVGSAGTLELPWNGEPSLVFDERGTSALRPHGDDAFARQLTGWLDAIEGGAPVADGTDGLAAVAMAEAAELSMATGQPVALEVG